MATLAEYLEAVVEDPEERRAFGRDPKGAVEAAGLQDEDKEVLLSRDERRIWERLSKSLGVKTKGYGWDIRIRLFSVWDTQRKKHI